MLGITIKSFWKHACIDSFERENVECPGCSIRPITKNACHFVDHHRIIQKNHFVSCLPLSLRALVSLRRSRHTNILCIDHIVTACQHCERASGTQDSPRSIGQKLRHQGTKQIPDSSLSLSLCFLASSTNLATSHQPSISPRIPFVQGSSVMPV